MNPPKQQRWRIVYDTIKTAIDQGKLAPGQRLPTEAEIGDQCGTRRDATRRGLQRLEAHGLITPSNGPHGRRVSVDYAPLVWPLSEFEVVGKRSDNPRTGTDNWASGIRAQGREPSELVEVADFAAWQPEAARAANLLNLSAPEQWMVRRRRWRYADGDLISIADTWLPDEVAKLPATSENGETIYPFKQEESVTLPGGIVHAVGIHQSWTRHLDTARHATPDEAELLGIEPGDALLEIVIIGFDDADRRFRVMVTISPGDKLAAQYDLQLNTEGGA